MFSASLEQTLDRVSESMSSFPGAWSLCGGWAVDLWLGRQTRDHGDVDITIFSDDQAQLFEHLRDWNMVPHDAVTPDSREPWDGRPLVLPAHIHARPPGEVNRALLMRWVTPPHSQAMDGLDFDLVFNAREGDSWLLCSEPRVPVPLACISGEGLTVPVVVPEVLLFYKATAYWSLPGYPREHDAADFNALLPVLSLDGREWLREAVSAVQPDHPWLPLVRP